MNEPTPQDLQNEIAALRQEIASVKVEIAEMKGIRLVQPQQKKRWNLPAWQKTTDAWLKGDRGKAREQYLLVYDPPPLELLRSGSARRGEGKTQHAKASRR